MIDCNIGVVVMLPNLLFYEIHSDPTVRDYLIKNLENFKKLGYKTLSLELSNETDIDGMKLFIESHLNDENLLAKHAQETAKALGYRWASLTPDAKSKHIENLRKQFELD